MLESPEETERVPQSPSVFQRIDPVGVSMMIIVWSNQKYAFPWFPTTFAKYVLTILSTISHQVTQC